ncbi:sensor domain-containing diguanylate cyclase [Motiliproteus coralliicola]|uniref:diguanylate cyclase n=1 Tax=Motiliproteus coralliicola TaxID=2283196 RepID=A0A369WKC0_9GAMM|nr:sensor domain-containing diguanylate cyclase [Motiliproteus coralliicola]RDE22500.1 sensor domain-containing diguanylate cyclase [Motiliproteus coralliicola]
MGLRWRISLWLLPFAVAVLGFIGSYYLANRQLLENQLQQTMQSALVSGSRELNVLLEQRSQEFKYLGRLIDECSNPRAGMDREQRFGLALGQVDGFSALAVSDLDGELQQLLMSPVASNRHILPRSVQGTSTLTRDTFKSLRQQLLQWQEQRQSYRGQIEALLDEQALMNQRGERNSQRYRQVQAQVAMLQGAIYQLPVTVLFSGASEVEQLGLPFRDDTYLFIRPYLNCDDQVAGFITAYLDWTRVEDSLYRTKQALLAQGFNNVDVVLADIAMSRWITKAGALADAGKPRGLDVMLEAEDSQLDRLGFIGSAAVSDPRQLMHRYRKAMPMVGIQGSGRRLLAEAESNFRLMVFIHRAEFEQRDRGLLSQALAWGGLSIGLLLVLIALLSKQIAQPVVDLTGSIKRLARGEKLTSSDSYRRDEIGQLIREFDCMAEALHHKSEQLLTQASTDSLTGCLTRRALTEVAQHLHQKTIATDDRLSLILMDLDHFKRINDQFGHSVGDKVLVAFCDQVRANLRSDDKFGRLGGEEFIVMFPGSGLLECLAIAERIRRSVAAMDLADENQQPITVTVSIGAYEWKTDDSFDQALRRGDGKLYQAKAMGRNRISF